MHIRTMQTHDLSACAALAYRAYLGEPSSHTVLPCVSEEPLLPLLSDLLSHGNAFVAVAHGELIGYLGFLPPFSGAFGNCIGAFSPLHACACFGKDPSRTFSELLSFSMEVLYRQGVTSVAVCRYAHEDSILRTLVFSGFGIRCSDLMRRTAPAAAACDGYTFRTASPSDTPHLLSLYNSLEAHMASSPIFMPKTPWSNERLASVLDHILVACKEDQPIAALLLEQNGETFLDAQPNTMHISSTFCHPDHRGTGVMHALVDFASDLAYRNGTRFLGVDCETLNPPAFRFWQKHFTPFTYSAVRRLDERLLRT